MNRWKIGFWILFSLLIIGVGCSLYSMVDGGYSLAYLKNSYSKTENDLDNIITIISATNLTKHSIKEALGKNDSAKIFDLTKDTIFLERTTLIFKHDTLRKISKNW